MSEATKRPALLCILQGLPSADYQYATTVAFHAAYKACKEEPEKFRTLFGTAGEYAIKAVMEEPEVQS